MSTKLPEVPVQVSDESPIPNSLNESMEGLRRDIQRLLKESQARVAQELIQGNQELIQGAQELIRGNQELIQGAQELIRGNQELIQGAQELKLSQASFVQEVRELRGTYEDLGGICGANMRRVEQIHPRRENPITLPFLPSRHKGNSSIGTGGIGNPMDVWSA